MCAFVLVSYFNIIVFSTMFRYVHHLLQSRERARSRSFPLFAFFHFLLCWQSARAANLLFAQTYEMHTRSAESISKRPRHQHHHHFDSIKLFSLHYYDMIFSSTIFGMIFTALARSCVFVCVFVSLSFVWHRQNEENEQQKVDAMHETISFAKHKRILDIFRNAFNRKLLILCSWIVVKIVCTRPRHHCRCRRRRRRRCHHRHRHTCEN